jgi:hypothetical protein
MTAVLSMARPFIAPAGRRPTTRLKKARLTIVGCHVLSGSSRSLHSGDGPRAGYRSGATAGLHGPAGGDASPAGRSSGWQRPAPGRRGLRGRPARTHARARTARLGDAARRSGYSASGAMAPPCVRPLRPSVALLERTRNRTPFAWTMSRTTRALCSRYWVLLAELTNAPRPTFRSVRRNKLTARPLIGARSGRLAPATPARTSAGEGSGNKLIALTVEVD